jgi:hypothetical protein
MKRFVYLLNIVFIFISLNVFAADYDGDKQIGSLDAHGGSLATTSKALVQDPVDTDIITTMTLQEIVTTVLGADYDTGTELTNLFNSKIGAADVPTNETDPITGTITGIVKANGAGTISAAVAGTDYLTPTGDGAGLSGVVTSESDPNALLTVDTDNVKDTHIDWGSGAGQVNADDIADGSTNAIPTLTQETNWDTMVGSGAQAVGSGDAPTFAATNISEPSNSKGVLPTTSGITDGYVPKKQTDGSVAWAVDSTGAGGDQLVDLVATSPLLVNETTNVNDALPGSDADITFSMPAATNSAGGYMTAAHVTALEAIDTEAELEALLEVADLQGDLAATRVTFSPTGTISSTTAQAAIAEVATEAAQTSGFTMGAAGIPFIVNSQNITMEGSPTAARVLNVGDFDMEIPAATAVNASGLILAAGIADGDHGAFTYSSGIASLDANTVDSDQYVDGSIDPEHVASGAWDFGTSAEADTITEGGVGVPNVDELDASSELAALIDDETGSGSIVFSTSPTLVTPILGIPTSGTLTNCTGLPPAAGITIALPSYSAAQTLTWTTNGRRTNLFTNSTTVEFTVWDCETANIGQSFSVWASDASLEGVPASGDHFVLFDGTALTANYEIDVPADARVKFVCTADDTWSVHSETDTTTDGGTAD